MELIAALRKIRACEGEVAAQVVLEHAIKEAVEAEREACIAATVGERVDSSVSAEDEVYNTALWHAVEAMQKRSNACGEPGLTEPGKD